MRQAVLHAAVGDDVMGEDPTVRQLERRAAQLLGKEAALFLPTGCMANTAAIAVHCSRSGHELVCGDRSHIYNWEAGAAARLLGVPLQPLPTDNAGRLSLADLARCRRPIDQHCARTHLVCLENTHNMCGGRVLPREYMDQVGAFCRQHGMPLHLDGARLANAAVALKLPMSALAAAADTVSLCLSKSLGAPMGSLLAGSERFIAEARFMRKLLGGGLRQSGFVACAGLLALDNIDRLAIDHDNAQRLAQGLAQQAAALVELASPVETNMVMVRLTPAAVSRLGGENNSVTVAADTLIERLKSQHQVLTGGADRWGVLRLVTHLDVDQADMEATIEAFSLLQKQVLG